MTPYRRILERLDGVREWGGDRAMARCPAHKDKRASLSIRELSDGRTLLHCFGGCEALDVLDAIGLEFGALFPERLPDAPRERRGFDAHGALRCIAHEAAVVALLAEEVAQQPASPAVRARLLRACSEIHSTLALVGEGPVPDELRRLRRSGVAA